MMDYPDLQKYCEGLKARLQHESKIFSEVLPHHGERGNNDEERIRQLLRKVLPKQFSVGTGFVMCSNSEVPVSSQTDIVIFDEWHNSALFQDVSASIFPIETVYGVVEVKRKLRRSGKGGLGKLLDDTLKIRVMQEHKWNSVPQSVSTRTEESEGTYAVQTEFQGELAPRTFLFAFDVNDKDWNSMSKLRLSLERAIQKKTANGQSPFVHGLVVLEKDWFLAQVAGRPGKSVQVLGWEGDCLGRFVHQMLFSLSSFPMYPASLKRYLRFDDDIGGHR